MMVSPKFDQTKLESGKIEDRIDVYEDRVKGWFLDQARILENKSNDAGFVILQIALAYIEGNAIYLKGEDSKNRSKEFFGYGFREIFKELEASNPGEVVEACLNGIYEQARCGLFHDGMTGKRVGLSGDCPNPVEVRLDSSKNVEVIWINPHKFLDGVEKHFERYIEKLKDPTDETPLENFEKAWSILHD